MRYKQFRPYSNKGFTLTDMVVGLGLVSILGLIAMSTGLQSIKNKVATKGTMDMNSFAKKASGILKNQTLSTDIFSSTTKNTTTSNQTYANMFHSNDPMLSNGAGFAGFEFRGFTMPGTKKDGTPNFMPMQPGGDEGMVMAELSLEKNGKTYKAEILLMAQYDSSGSLTSCVHAGGRLASGGSSPQGTSTPVWKEDPGNPGMVYADPSQSPVVIGYNANAGNIGGELTVFGSLKAQAEDPIDPIESCNPGTMTSDPQTHQLMVCGSDGKYENAQDPFMEKCEKRDLTFVIDASKPHQFAGAFVQAQNICIDAAAPTGTNGGQVDTGVFFGNWYLHGTTGWMDNIAANPYPRHTFRFPSYPNATHPELVGKDIVNNTINSSNFIIGEWPQDGDPENFPRSYVRVKETKYITGAGLVNNTIVMTFACCGVIAKVNDE